MADAASRRCSFTNAFGHLTGTGGAAASWARAEAAAGQLLPWVPVAFGSGIAIYFSADHEPVLWVVSATAVALFVVALLLRRHRMFAAAVMVTAVAAGFAVATIKTAQFRHVVLMRPMYTPLLQGFVETSEVRERTDRFVLRVVRMDNPQYTSSSIACGCRSGRAPRPPSVASWS